MVLNVHKTIRLIRDGEKPGGKEGMEVGRGGDYIPFATLSPFTTRMIPALRWAVMRAILMFQ